MKKISRRNFLLTAGVVSAAALLAACGSSTSSASSESASESTASSAESAASNEAVEYPITIHPDENPFTIVETWKRTGGSGRKSSSRLSFHAAGADARTSSPVSNGTGGNHGGRFGRTWTISIPEVHAEYDQRGLCRS